MANKMDSERAGCSHGDKAHGPVRQGSLDRGQPWICRTCGEEGCDAIVAWVAGDYDRLRSKKQQGGFDVAR